MDHAHQTEEELENFRRQWREEVTARSKGKAAAAAAAPAPAASSSSAHAASTSKAPAPRVIPRKPHGVAHSVADHDGHEDGEGRTYHDVVAPRDADRRRLSESGPSHAAGPKREPRTALEHYEQAVEREGQGQLGDSIDLYRKAFRLDDRVHEAYKMKHFKQSWYPAKPAPGPASAPAPASTAGTSSAPAAPTPPSLPGTSSSITDLITDFSRLSIPPAEPPTDLSPPPPCPIASLPEELLTAILLHAGLDDLATFARLPLVCKRLAYLVMTEDRIWRRLALGPEFGFASQPYRFLRPLSDNTPLPSSLPSFMILPPTPLVPTSRYPTYRALLHARPRIRFPGLYISTVNYTRPGAATPNQRTWGPAAPVLVVTYYRYLRFYRDGACLALLTTVEPAEVVPFFDREYVGDGWRRAVGVLPGVAVMRDAMLGRWRLSGPEDRGASSSSSSPSSEGEAEGEGEGEPEEEGTLYVETPGVTPKYVYAMTLGVASGGAGGKTGVRHNKLVWKAYWSYNRLTDDWAPFGLRHDRPFWWSRVRRWGGA